MKKWKNFFKKPRSQIESGNLLLDSNNIHLMKEMVLQNKVWQIS